MRFQFGGPQLDAVTGKQLGFATVVVMHAPSRVEDEVGHVLYEQFGSGPATVFTGGQAYPGTWRKEDREARTRFFDSSGKEISFERGPIFIELLDQRSSIAFVAEATSLPPLPEYEPPQPPGEFEEEPTAMPTATPFPTEAATITPIPSPTATNTPSGTPTRTPNPTATATATDDPTI
jgi:hypothetical protein